MEEKSMRDMFRLGFGEEVANCVTHGIMAFLCICSLPAAVVYSYNKSGAKLAAGVSVFILCLFLMFWYPHCIIACRLVPHTNMFFASWITSVYTLQ